MKPKPNRNLTLSWTPQREKASGNHLLPRKQATSLTSPLCCLYHNLPLTLPYRESCINSLTSPTLLLLLLSRTVYCYVYTLVQILLKTNRVKRVDRHLDFWSSRGHPKRPPFSLPIFDKKTS